jgi:hypothetical protein
MRSLLNQLAAAAITGLPQLCLQIISADAAANREAYCSLKKKPHLQTG